jgi:hypothetical protein
MAGSGVSRANANKAIRQEALREQLAEQCRVQHIVDNIVKLEDLSNPLEANDISRITKANEQRLKLLNKYLPDLRSVELSGPEGGAQEHKWEVTFVNATPESK